MWWCWIELEFENRRDSDVLRTVGELDNDLREDIRYINNKLEVFKKKIEKYETVENLKLHNKALEDRMEQLENKSSSEKTV